MIEMNNDEPTLRVVLSSEFPMIEMNNDEPLTKDDRSHIRKWGIHSWALHVKLAGLRYGVTRDRTAQRKCESPTKKKPEL